MHACDLLWQVVFRSLGAAIDDGDGAAGVFVFQSSHDGGADKACSPSDNDLLGIHTVDSHGEVVDNLLEIDGFVQGALVRSSRDHMKGTRDLR